MSKSPDAGFHNVVIEILREVGEAVILPRYRKLADGDIRTKTSPSDLVTIADEEAEQLLTKRLPPLVAGSRIVGEENASKDSTVLELLAGAEPVWIVDPVDGTANFVNGIDRFAMMVALVQGGQTIKGWIHNPLSGQTLWAERGCGTWLQHRGGKQSRYRIAEPPVVLKDMVGAIHHRAFAAQLGNFKRNLRQGSAAHDYWALTDGRIHLLCYRKLKPWDHAAGVLIHAEAGGYSRLLTGEPYRPAWGQEGILCAPNREVWEQTAALASASP